MPNEAEKPLEDSEETSETQSMERPIECGECRRPIHTCYCSVSQNGIQKTGMCAVCPVLKKKMYGYDSSQQPIKGKEAQAPVCCGSCGLTRDEVQMGSRLGCSLCYEIFRNEIFDEIISLEHLPSKLKDAKHTSTLHIGKTPAAQREWDPSVTLVSLQKALQETLGREDYEQAAWLRDKIQALTKKQKETGNGESGTTRTLEKS